MKERRKYPRIKTSLPLKISNSNFEFVTETKNISGNGAYCFVDKPIEPLTKLKIVILAPFKKKDHILIKKINCNGVVVRKEIIKNNNKDQYSIGIYFNEIKEKDRKILLSYLSSQSSLVYHRYN